MEREERYQKALNYLNILEQQEFWDDIIELWNAYADNNNYDELHIYENDVYTLTQLFADKQTLAEAIIGGHYDSEYHLFHITGLGDIESLPFVPEFLNFEDIANAIADGNISIKIDLEEV